MKDIRPNLRVLPRMEAATITETLQDWLAGLPLSGVDVVRARLATAIAAELDSSPPAYVVPRLVGALSTLLAEIAESVSPISNGGGKLSARDLLADVFQ